LNAKNTTKVEKNLKNYSKSFFWNIEHNKHQGDMSLETQASLALALALALVLLTQVNI
jgi:hypothetical protein